MDDPTRTLVESAVHGDRAAVDQLLERYMPGLEAFVRLRSGKFLLAKESSSDIVQSVCREVLQDAGDFRYTSEAHFKHWLFTTAMRKIANRYEYYRADKRDPAKEVRIEALASDASSGGEAQLYKTYQTVCGPGEVAAAREQIAVIEEAFAKLPENYRDVILLSRIVGLSAAEIAVQTGRNEGAVRTLLSRALTKLSGALRQSKTGG